MSKQLHHDTIRLGKETLWKLILRLSMPGILAMITMTFYNLADAFWVAKLGHEAVAAITVVMPIQFFVIVVGLGSGMGISSLTSREFGKQNVEITNRIVGQVFPIAALFGITSVLIYTTLTEPLLTIGGITPDLMDYGKEYLVIVACGAPFILIQVLLNEALRASGNATKPMIFSITAAVTNIVLDPVLIFGIGPFPEMGIGGAAVATVISQFIGALCVFSYIVVLKKSAFNLKWTHLKPNFPVLKEIYSIGLPTMFIEASECITFIILNQILSDFGSVALAAGGLAMRIIDFFYMPVIGVAQGLLPIIGYNFGAKLWHRLWGAVRISSIGLVIVLGIATLIAILFSNQLMGMFTSEPELIAEGSLAIRIFLSGVFVFAPSHVFTTAFMGMGKGKTVFFLSIVRYGILIATLLILPNFIGLSGAWIAMPVADFIGFIIAGIWLRKLYKQTMVFNPE